MTDCKSQGRECVGGPLTDLATPPRVPLLDATRQAVPPRQIRNQPTRVPLLDASRQAVPPRQVRNQPTRVPLLDATRQAVQPARTRFPLAQHCLNAAVVGRFSSRRLVRGRLQESGTRLTQRVKQCGPAKTRFTPARHCLNAAVEARRGSRNPIRDRRRTNPDTSKYIAAKSLPVRPTR